MAWYTPIPQNDPPSKVIYESKIKRFSCRSFMWQGPQLPLHLRRLERKECPQWLVHFGLRQTNLV